MRHGLIPPYDISLDLCSDAHIPKSVLPVEEATCIFIYGQNLPESLPSDLYST